MSLAHPGLGRQAWYFSHNFGSRPIQPTNMARRRGFLSESRVRVRPPGATPARRRVARARPASASLGAAVTPADCHWPSPVVALVLLSPGRAAVSRPCPAARRCAHQITQHVHGLSLSFLTVQLPCRCLPALFCPGHKYGSQYWNQHCDVQHGTTQCCTMKRHTM